MDSVVSRFPTRFGAELRWRKDCQGANSPRSENDATIPRLNVKLQRLHGISAKRSLLAQLPKLRLQADAITTLHQTADFRLSLLAAIAQAQH